MTSEPKPGALAPAGVGRSIFDTVGSAALGLTRAVADWGGVIQAFPLIGWQGGGWIGTWAASNRIMSKSQASAQAGEKSHSGIAVGRLHADFALVGLHGQHGLGADAAIGAAGVEAERGQTALDFFDVGQGRRRLAAWELLHERLAADAAVAQMAERERIAGRRVVAFDRKEIGAEQERGPAGFRQPRPRRVVRPRKRCAVGARDAGRLPGR